jgi:hypothetical protein
MTRWNGALAFCMLGRISRCALTGAVKTAKALGEDDHCNRFSS